jgi:hypothetical protein
MAEFLHEVVRKRELSIAEFSSGLEGWITHYHESRHQRVAEQRREFIESILGRLEDGSDDADL